MVDSAVLARVLRATTKKGRQLFVLPPTPKYFLLEPPLATGWLLALGLNSVGVKNDSVTDITDCLSNEGNDVVERGSKQSAKTSSDMVHAHHHALHRIRRLCVRKLQRYNATESKETE